MAAPSPAPVSDTWEIGLSDAEPGLLSLNINEGHEALLPALLQQLYNSNPRITSLNLGDASLRPNQVADLLLALRDNTCVTALNLSLDNDETLADLPALLHANRTLTKLQIDLSDRDKVCTSPLQDNPFIVTGPRMVILQANLSKALGLVPPPLDNPTTCTLLDLSLMNYDFSGEHEFFTQLMSHPSLTAVAMRSLEIEIGEAHALAQGLRLNHRLRSLKISRERCLNRGDLKALADALSNHPSLTELALVDVGMGGNGVVDLCVALKGNQMLTSLDISENDLASVASQQALLSLVEANKALTTVGMRYTNIRVEVENRVNIVLRSRARWSVFNTVVATGVQPAVPESDAASSSSNPSIAASAIAGDALQTVFADFDIQDNSYVCLQQQVSRLERERDSLLRQLQLQEQVRLQPVINPVNEPLLVQLSSIENEYAMVEAHFHKSQAGMPAYAGLQFRVTNVHSVNNPALRWRFIQKLNSFCRQGFGAPAEAIRVAYHGTHPDSINAICESNLSMEKLKSVTDDGWFGEGLYLSQHADYVMQYYTTLKPGAPHKIRRVQVGDRGRLLRFDILPGRIHLLEDFALGVRLDPVGANREHDSHVSPSGFEYVLFENDQALPTYVIEFEVVAAPGRNFDHSRERGPPPGF